jgi:D-xylose transport system substrate-binding protein
VILLVNLDSARPPVDPERSRGQGVKAIDYDRLTLGGKTAYYVSFDNPSVGA